MKYLSPFSSRYGLTPFAGGNSLASMEKEFERLFGSLPSLFDVGGDWVADSDKRSLNPRWYEHDDALVVQVELPGVEAKDLNLEARENALSLSAERKTRSKDEGAEGSYSYRQSFSIPEGVDAEKASASFKDGILSVSFPKAAALKPRRIEVK